MLQGGAPVFLLDADSQETRRLGFYTTRWVQAATLDEAGVVASRLVLDQLATNGTKNAPDQPIKVKVEDVTQVPLLEALRRGTGRGFTFYSDDAP
jgi:hypothetical protein